MSKFKDGLNLFGALALIAKVLLPPVAFIGTIGNFMYQERQAREQRSTVIKSVAFQNCTIQGSSNLTRLMNQACFDAVAGQINAESKGLKSDDDFHSYRRKIESHIAVNRALLENVLVGIEQGIRSLNINNAQFFKDSEISINIQDVVDVDNGRIGSFEIVTRDPSNVTRRFSYDHVLGNFTQSVGDLKGKVTTSETILIAGSGGLNIGMGSGSGTLIMPGTAFQVACGAEQSAACAIKETVEKTLSGLSVEEAKIFSEIVTKLKRQGLDQVSNAFALN